ncbi:hypothetical protein HanRHA438_Chr02g0090231 [Helianthus annuus]|nr:hypothetical protein HanIR_Chr02g0091791 [Helianthus annuus]KAJ0619709.1 hypothetical protein HanHA89_Chr02g0074291 [Helianthus annuus]KAJ0787170.1 hypothetical protein HanOQP8_Chr02g0079471 [Helianthus annuus]KAJ0941054.1 hypothetical protein HanRHA438_Chr02g0090231 [Helianthus annuus]
MAIVSYDEIAPELEIFTSDTESDPDMLSEDEDDFQPFALPDFGDDLPHADGFPDEDPFVIPIPVHDHLIIGHPDGEHIVSPILDPVPLVVIPPEDWPFDDLFDDDVDLFVAGPPVDAQGDGEIDEDVLFATESDDDTTMSAAPSPSLDPTPPHDPEHVPDPDPILFGQPDVAPVDPKPIPAHDHVPFGLLDIAPLIPDPVPAPVDLLVVEPFIPPPTPANDIPAPRPGEGTSGQHPSYDPFASRAFPQIPQTAPFAPFTSSTLDEPLRWFPSYSMPISDPYHPSHFVGYTRDELLLSLQLQFEVLSHRVLELELTPRPPPCPCQSTFVPPHSSTSPFAHPPAALTPFPDFDARFLTIEQHISYLLHCVYELEEELADVRKLLFFPPPPPPP